MCVCAQRAKNVKKRSFLKHHSPTQSNEGKVSCMRAKSDAAGESSQGFCRDDIKKRCLGGGHYNISHLQQPINKLYLHVDGKARNFDSDHPLGNIKTGLLKGTSMFILARWYRVA